MIRIQTGRKQVKEKDWSTGLGVSLRYTHIDFEPVN